MCDMKAQRQASGGVSTEAAHPRIVHALPSGVASERLENGVSSAKVASMNRKSTNKSGSTRTENIHFERIGDYGTMSAYFMKITF